MNTYDEFYRYYSQQILQQNPAYLIEYLYAHTSESINHLGDLHLALVSAVNQATPLIAEIKSCLKSLILHLSQICAYFEAYKAFVLSEDQTIIPQQIRERNCHHFVLSDIQPRFAIIYSGYVLTAELLTDDEIEWQMIRNMCHFKPDTVNLHALMKSAIGCKQSNEQD